MKKNEQFEFSSIAELKNAYKQQRYIEELSYAKEEYKQNKLQIKKLNDRNLFLKNKIFVINRLLETF